MSRLKREQLSKLSVVDLLTARDEAIDARDGLDSFYDLRFRQVTDANDSNPRCLPTMRYPGKSELVNQQIREAGSEIEGLIDDYDITIDHITEELVERCK